ncbi:MAG: hypothetical protein PVH26_01280, partial [Desulfosarcina sp.]
HGRAGFGGLCPAAKKPLVNRDRERIPRRLSKRSKDPAHRVDGFGEGVQNRQHPLRPKIPRRLPRVSSIKWPTDARFKNCGVNRFGSTK